MHSLTHPPHTPTYPLTHSLTKVIFEDKEGEYIDNYTEELCKEHEAVPGAEGEYHHQELREDERCECDRYHMDEL